MADQIKITIKDLPVPPPSKLMELLYENSELARQVLTVHNTPNPKEKEDFIKSITPSFEIKIDNPYECNITNPE